MERDASTGGLRVTVKLPGVIDGMVDPLPHDGVQQIADYRGEQPTSTYYFCHSSLRAYR